MGNKIKTKIAKITIILFMLAVDIPSRICLFIMGYGFFGYGMVFFTFTLVLNLGELILGSGMKEFTSPFLPFMTILSMSISGFSGLQVSRRVRPYGYNPPHLERKVINKQTSVIPLCVLGIACDFYMLVFGDLDKLVSLFIIIHIVAFLYSMVETIILKIAVLTLDNTREAPVGGVSTSTKEDMHQ